jgi:hypothetical protein
MNTFRNLLQAAALAGVVTLAAQTIALAEVVTCVGGALEQTIVVTQNDPDTLADNAGNQVLNNSVINAGASGGNPDTYIVTLSGEADNTTAGGFFSVQAQVRVDGGPWIDINPNSPNTFHQGPTQTTASMTWCTRVQANASAAIRILWDSVGPGNTATLDDYTVMVQRLN